MSESTGTTTAAAATTGNEQTPTNTQTTGQQNAGATGTPAGQTGQETIQQAAAEAIRKHKLKVDGQEIEVDDNELKRGYSHQRAANKILQEGKAARKQAEEFVTLMKDKSKLFEVIKKLGHDPRKLTEEYLAEQLQDEMMDPRERQFRDTEKQLKHYRDLEEKQKKQEEQRHIDTLKAKFSEDYTKQFVDALKESSLPANKETVAEMAKYIHRAAKLKFQMTAQEAAKLVREDIENRQRSLYGEADAETLVRLLGDQGLQKIRGYDTNRLKDPAAFLKTPQDQGEVRERRSAASSGKRMSPSEWRAFNRK